MTRPRRFGPVRAIVVLAASVGLLAGCAGEADRTLSLDASIDGRRIAEATPRNPIPLRPTRESVLLVQMRNESDRPIEVRRVRLEGDVLSIDFLTYDVRVRTPLEPGATRSLEVPLDFFDLERQATGYLRAHLRLYDADRRAVAEEELVLDVRGSLLSTMGVFALTLLVLTAVSGVRAVRDAKRRRLPGTGSSAGCGSSSRGWAWACCCRSAARCCGCSPSPRRAGSRSPSCRQPARSRSATC